MKNQYQLAAQKLNTYMRLPFEAKFMLSHRMITQALAERKRPLISSSFGKDSTVLIHMVRQHTTNFEVVFNETGVQLKENLAFRDYLTKEWDLKVHILKPLMSFWECVEQYGYPKPSRNSKTGDRRNPACCKYLKELPMERFIKAHDFDLNFVGLLGDEGKQRRWAFIRQGCALYKHKGFGLTKCIPLIWWTSDNIWKYIKRYNVPVSEAYAKYGINRTGCVPCTGHIGWEKSIAKTNPKILTHILKENCGGQHQLTHFPTELLVNSSEKSESVKY